MSAAEKDEHRAVIRAERDAVLALVAQWGPISPDDLLEHAPRMTAFADQRTALAWHLDRLWDHGRVHFNGGGDALRTVEVVR